MKYDKKMIAGEMMDKMGKKKMPKGPQKGTKTPARKDYYNLAKKSGKR